MHVFTTIFFDTFAFIDCVLCFSSSFGHFFDTILSITTKINHSHFPQLKLQLLFSENLKQLSFALLSTGTVSFLFSS